MGPGRPSRATLVAVIALATAPAMADLASEVENIEEQFYMHGAGMVRCVEELCEFAQDFETCREGRCGSAEEDWSLRVTKVRYDGEHLTLAGKLGYKLKPGGPEGFEPRKTPVWLGLTVVNLDGSINDVPARKVPMAKIPGPFQFKAKVGPEAHTWRVAIWHQEFKPCAADRPGCKEQGHVLVGLLAWEPRCAYQCVMASDCGFGSCLGGTPVLPGKGPLKVRVLEAGGGAAWAKKAVPAARKVLSASVRRNGRKLAVHTKGKAKNERKCLQVLYRDTRNAKRAAVVAKEVLEAGGFFEESDWGPEYPEHKVTHWDKAPADFVVAVGKDCDVQSE